LLVLINANRNPADRGVTLKMESMKFLLTTSFYPPYHLGGDAIHVKYLSEELQSRGHEVHVLYSLDAYTVKKKHFSQKNEQTEIYTYPVKTHFNSSSYAAYLLGNSTAITTKFDSLINQIKPDVIHHHNISLLGYNLLKKRSNYLNLFTAHDYWLVCQQNNLLKGRAVLCQHQHKGSCFFCSLNCKRPPQIWRLFTGFKKAIEDIDLIIAPSNFVARILKNKISAKTIVLPNFVPTPPSNIGPANFENYFLFVGMLEKHKGILDLLQVVKDLKRAINPKLVILGEGSLKNTVIGFTKKNSLSSSIFYRGFVEKKEELYPLYKNALALIIPSICAENAPLTALEALSVGSPVIASNVGGLPEIVGKYDEKLLFNNWIELENILLNFKKTNLDSEKAKTVYYQNFSADAYVGKYIANINRLNN